METKITLGSFINVDLSIFDHPIITILKKIEGYDPRFQLKSYLYLDGRFILLSKDMHIKMKDIHSVKTMGDSLYVVGDKRTDYIKLSMNV